MEQTSVQKNDAPKITAVSALNGRSLRVDYEDGTIRLFDGFRLRGPKYIPLVDPNVFITARMDDGDLYWEDLDIRISASYVRKFSVPYDPDYKPENYVPTKKEIIGAKLAVIIFPIMAIAGLIGTVWWWINN